MTHFASRGMHRQSAPCIVCEFVATQASVADQWTRLPSKASTYSSHQRSVRHRIFEARLTPSFPVNLDAPSNLAPAGLGCPLSSMSVHRMRPYTEGDMPASEATHNVTISVHFRAFSL
ncbi:hypothetical protein K466DRAFT_311646 [Polyporus arcularius HHB13444]|uniref:Uncharacterized protein n=1 Tax=Polyporus arcularius HHB13444 TaxID=1314778 RepID=A0A5C3P0M4_9APHY|nr:hypothetical protein K466DRAFT_311646 [Polyporus arcularius HHB13444]